MVFQRIVNYWVSTFITEKLLSSPTFHRMAATTHKHVSNATNKGKNFVFIRFYYYSIIVAINKSVLFVGILNNPISKI